MFLVDCWHQIWKWEEKKREKNVVSFKEKIKWWLGWYAPLGAFVIGDWGNQLKKNENRDRKVALKSVRRSDSVVLVETN